MKEKKRRGTRLGFLIFDLYIKLGIKHAYALLYFVALHYLFFDRKAVKLSRAYVMRRFPESKGLGRIMHIYRLFLHAGRNLIDLRQYELDPEKVQMECDTARIRELVAEGRGLVMLTAHIGNWQVMMRNLPDLGAKVNIVMRPEDNPAVKEFLNLDEDERNSIHIIDASAGADAVLEIMKELTAGNIVSIMGDSLREEYRTIDVDFLGGKSVLPEGPFLISASSKAPVIVVMNRKLAPCSYLLQVNELVLPEKKLNKREKIQGLASLYIKVLESYLDEFPYEWTPGGNL